MGTSLLRTIQVLLAMLLIAAACIASMWILGVIDPLVAKTSFVNISSLLGIFLVAALAMTAVFSIGGEKETE